MPLCYSSTYNSPESRTIRLRRFHYGSSPRTRPHAPLPRRLCRSHWRTSLLRRQTALPPGTPPWRHRPPWRAHHHLLSDRDLLGAQYWPKPAFLAFLPFPPLIPSSTRAVSVSQHAPVRLTSHRPRRKLHQIPRLNLRVARVGK